MESSTLLKSCSDQKYRLTNSITRCLKDKAKWEINGQSIGIRVLERRSNNTDKGNMKALCIVGMGENRL